MSILGRSAAYLDEKYLFEALATGGVLLSRGSQLVGYNHPFDARQLEAFRTGRDPLTGGPVSPYRPDPPARFDAPIMSADGTVNALFAGEPADRQALILDAFRATCQVFLDMREDGCHARFKVDGKQHSAPAYPIGMAFIHVLARPVNGRPEEISLHGHFPEDHSVVAATAVDPAAGRPLVRSELNRRARELTMSERHEGFQPTFTAELLDRRFDAVYEPPAPGKAPLCRIPWLDPGYVERVTGTRARQIREHLGKEGLADTKLNRLRADAETAEPKTPWESVEQVRAAVDRAREHARRVQEEVRQEREAGRPAALVPVPVHGPALPPAVVPARTPALPPPPPPYPPLTLVPGTTRPPALPTPAQAHRVRVAHIRGVRQRRGPSYLSGRGRIVVVHDGVRFLSETRKVRAVDAVRKQVLDADWTG